jgi:hypothetical protein
MMSTDDHLTIRTLPAEERMARRPSRVYPEGRRCSGCDIILSRYNPQGFCSLCARKRADTKKVLPEGVSKVKVGRNTTVVDSRTIRERVSSVPTEWLVAFMVARGWGEAEAVRRRIYRLMSSDKIRLDKYTRWSELLDELEEG